MKLLLIRHVPAVRTGSVGTRDGERPLTSRGRARVRVAAHGLARIAERPDVLLTSPPVRAGATHEIAAAALKRDGAALLDLPDGPAAAGQLRCFVKPRILRSLGGA